MENQYRNQNRDNRGNNPPRGAEYYVQQVQSKFPNGIYEELLTMQKSQRLDEIDKCIRNFLDENTKDKGKGVTSSQLRNVYAKVKSLKKGQVNALKMLRPNLAYVIARQKNEKARLIMHWLDDMIQRVRSENSEDMEGFKRLFEAVVAYHKYYEEINQSNSTENRN